MVEFSFKFQVPRILAVSKDPSNLSHSSISTLCPPLVYDETFP